MNQPLKKGDKGPKVRDLQRLLRKRGLIVEIDGDFGAATYRAVRAFQTENVDQQGQPLVVDGKVGPLSWWSLTHPKPDLEVPSAVEYDVMPPARLGGSAVGRQALHVAIEELKAGACEIGGNNCGKWVSKYLAPAGLAEGQPWCASFVSWCFLQGCGADKEKMPFPYTPSARTLLSSLKKKAWAYGPSSEYEPLPGDLVIWWRVRADGWQGHIGLVHQVRDGMLYTIEGNRSTKVQGFSYVLSRMDKLLGFGHAPG